MIVPIVTVFVVILLSMIVTRVATIALTVTGMSREAAKFQARSALTGAGYTTTEAESIVTHPVRRRIVATLMLVGSAGIVSVIGGVALTFAQTEGNRDAATAAVSLVVGIGFLLWLMTRDPVDRVLSRVIRRLLDRYTDLEVRDYESLLEVHGGYMISELHIDPGDWIAERTLAEMRLNDEGVLVLGVQRHDGGYVGAPTGTTIGHVGDILLLYGHQDRIAELDMRPQGPAGDARHAESTTEHAVAEATEALAEDDTQDSDDGDARLDEDDEPAPAAPTEDDVPAHRSSEP